MVFICNKIATELYSNKKLIFVYPRFKTAIITFLCWDKATC